MKIDSIGKLRSIYKSPSDRAIKKDIGKIDAHVKHFIETSPFVVLSTYNKIGQVDASPRGGHNGFVKVLNETCLLIPDARGNNRLDSLTNLIETGKIGLLFLIPGIEETLRINGEALITTDEEKIGYFQEDAFPTITVIEVRVQEAYVHCAKAFMRSKLWDQDSQIDGNSFPSMGEMLKDHLQSDQTPETRQETLKRYDSEL